MSSDDPVAKFANSDLVARIGLLLVLIASYLPDEMSDAPTDTLSGLLLAYLFIVAGAIVFDLGAPHDR
ncbi:hypothetical protein [Haloparvum sp. AD34]